MGNYFVRWEVDIEADTYQEAVSKAAKMHNHSDYPTTVYSVWGDKEKCIKEVHALTDEPMIYDSWRGDEDCDPGFADRYTVFLQPNHPDPEIRRCFLGCSEGGRSFSQWGEIDNDDDWDQLGKQLTLGQLDKETRDHILRRAGEVSR